MHAALERLSETLMFTVISLNAEIAAFAALPQEASRLKALDTAKEAERQLADVIAALDALAP
jgi:hypothetical protein